ncbi:MAG TPA: hypothetical protein VKV79_08240 [Terriglobia bacterium]|nr:hypothetical protein [Terriglobia bacterium]
MARKYKQRGYMDSGSGRREERSGQKNENFGPKTPQMPGKYLVFRCSSCGTVLSPGFDPKGKCPQCGFELHSCKQCTHFDPSARFECTQPITARIPKKDGPNECNYFSPRMTLERQTSTGAPTPDDPRKAFEALFRK